MQIKAAIVGLGNIGFRYDIGLDNKFIYSHARAFNKHPGFTLLGGVDSDQSLRTQFSDIYSIPSFNSATKLVQVTSPDIISIATPTDTHLSILKDVVNSDSLKSILMEKPLANNFEECKKIYHLCSQHKIDLFINFVRRCDPGIKELKQLIAKKTFEGNFEAEVIFSKGLLHNGIHFIDIFIYLFGALKKISASDEFVLHFSNGKAVFKQCNDSCVEKNSFKIKFPTINIEYSSSGVININYKDDIIKKNKYLNLNTNLYQYHSIDSIFRHTDINQSELFVTETWIEELEYIYSKINKFETINQ